MFVKTVRKNDVDAPVEFSLKFTKRARVNCYDVTVKKDSLLVYVLKFLEVLVSWYGSIVVRKRDEDMKGPDFLIVLKMASTSYERGNCEGFCVSFRR